jgi:hypothetical protein
LAVTTGALDRERTERMAAQLPVVPFGVPSFWPYIPDVTPYHNAGIWPQVVGFYAWAGAEAGNAMAVEHALASIYRAAALFLTNKENWVAETGHFEGTEVNSDRFMASAAAQVATQMRVLFGIRLEADRMVLRPFVPRAYAGTRRLTNLRYRDAVLTVVVHGWGSRIAEVKLDGRRAEEAVIPAGLRGAHTVEITLDGNASTGALNLVANRATPATPMTTFQAGRLQWKPVSGAARYLVFRNGKQMRSTSATSVTATETSGMAEYQVAAVDSAGATSFLSEPVRIAPAAAVRIVRGGPEPVRLPADSTRVVTVNVVVPVDGWYAIDVRYANGNGAVSYGDRASVRTLLVDGGKQGIVLLPQRGINKWEDWGYSNAVCVELRRGSHRIGVAYRSANANMNRATDYALLEHVRVTRLAPLNARTRARC